MVTKYHMWIMTKTSNTFWDFAVFISPLAIIFLNDRTHYQLYSIMCTCTFFYCQYLWSETIWVHPLTTGILGLACTIVSSNNFYILKEISFNWQNRNYFTYLITYTVYTIYIVYTYLFRLGSLHKLRLH